MKHDFRILKFICGILIQLTHQMLQLLADLLYLGATRKQLE